MGQHVTSIFHNPYTNKCSVHVIKFVHLDVCKTDKCLPTVLIHRHSVVVRGVRWERWHQFMPSSTLCKPWQLQDQWFMWCNVRFCLTTRSNFCIHACKKTRAQLCHSPWYMHMYLNILFCFLFRFVPQGEMKLCNVMTHQYPQSTAIINR